VHHPGFQTQGFSNCAFHVNPLSRISPRYLTSVVRCNVCPLRVGSFRPRKFLPGECYYYHFLWIDRQMSPIIFFMFFPTSGQLYVWRTPKEECLVPAVKHGGESVMMMLAAISWYRRGQRISI